MHILFNYIINLIYSIFFISVLINQYYDIKRFLKVILTRIFKKDNLIILIVSLFSLVFIKKQTYLYYLLNLGFSILFIRINVPLKYRLTRRNITLCLISSFFYCLLVPVSYLTTILSLLFGYLFTLPIEKLIQRKYMKKAKNKILKINPIVIGITGSYGKTTFKHLLYEMLSSKYNVLISKGNINTPMGICKTINENLSSKDEILILELGIDQVNGMDKFKKFLELDIGVITSIGENHLSTFKSIDNTIRGKFKIKELIKKDGRLYINNDSFYLKKIETDCSICKFTSKRFSSNNVSIEGIKIDYNHSEINIPLYGKYVYSYLDGIIKICEFLGLNEDYISLGLSNLKPVNRRLEVKKYKEGYFINDSYNTNLKGVNESINLLKSLNKSKVVIVGGLIEQGNMFYLNNLKLQNLLFDMDVIFIGEDDHPLISNHHFNKLYIVKNLNDAYTLVEDNQYVNILQLAKGEDIYLR
jgi:UDP-N-acetylmuramoyl-tripeptide--D-alanyl-D-alanine ligase